MEWYSYNNFTFPNYVCCKMKSYCGKPNIVLKQSHNPPCKKTWNMLSIGQLYMHSRKWVLTHWASTKPATGAQCSPSTAASVLNTSQPNHKHPQSPAVSPDKRTDTSAKQGRVCLGGGECVCEDPETEAVLQHELSVCHLAGDRYPNNYNAWTHRIWLLHRFAQCHTQVSHSQQCMMGW